MYKVQEFAKLAGVTVRALHHYGRLKLLRPRDRSRDTGFTRTAISKSWSRSWR